MNPERLPVLNGRQVLRALGKAGFVVENVLKHSGDVRRTVTVPVHPGRDIKRGTLRSILRQAGFTVEEFVQLL